MFNSFLTAIDTTHKNNKYNHDNHQNNSNLHLAICNQIRSLIDAMPSSEICVQAALNIGLSSNLLDFKKLNKIIDCESSMPSLTFTLTQLKALSKECNKLKKMTNNQSYRSQSPSRQTTEIYQNFYSNSESMNVRTEKREINFQQKLANALKEQMSFRIKVKNFYSTDKLEKKGDYLKKRAEKAKNMNKKAFKIYKNFREKEREQIELFKPESQEDFQHKTKAAEKEPKLRKKRYVTNFAYDLVVSKDSDFEESQDDYKRYNTAETGRRAQISILKKRQPQNVQNRDNNQRFEEMRRKQLKTRQKKRQIEMVKEETAIFKLIKKHEKLNIISSEHEKKMVEKFKKSKDKKRQTLFKQFTQDGVKPTESEVPDLEEQIKSRCEQKILNKELILQQKVNRIREQLKAKEQRVMKHRDNIEKEHQNHYDFNEQYLKSYNQKIRKVKQQYDLRREQTIRSRLQQGKQKQQYEQLMHNISKMSEIQIKKHLQKLNREQFQSHSFIHN